MTEQNSLRPRITVATAGHLSTCPRMVKAADALHAHGYTVRVVSASHTPWAIAADEALHGTRGWAWTRVDCSRDTARRLHLSSGVRSRLAKAITRRIGAVRTPIAVAVRAYSRLHDELAAAIAAEPADLVYAGTTGALAAAAAAANHLDVPYGLDLEDFHSGEHPDGIGTASNALAERIERSLLTKAAFLTAGSPLIAAAYTDRYGVASRAIHNTYSIRFDGTAPRTERGLLRLYWFSQTIGPGRGLENVVRALGASGVHAELHLRGRLDRDYGDALRDLHRTCAPLLRILFLPPTASDEIVASAHGYDVGLSCEESTALNRCLCLGNKIFVYLASGCPVVLSGTPAQTVLAQDLGDAAFTYEVGNVPSLAELFRGLAADPERRLRARSAARRAAVRRWHWEHREDRGALLNIVDAAVGVDAAVPIA